MKSFISAFGVLLFSLTSMASNTYEIPGDPEEIYLITQVNGYDVELRKYCETPGNCKDLTLVTIEVPVNDGTDTLAPPTYRVEKTNNGTTRIIASVLAFHKPYYMKREPGVLYFSVIVAGALAKKDVIVELNSNVADYSVW